MTPNKFEQYFQTCVSQTDSVYKEARDSIVALGDEARTWLQQRTVANWQEQLLISILHGWLGQAERFAQVGEIVTSISEIDGSSRPRAITGQLSAAKKATILSSLGEAIVPRLLEMALKTNELSEHQEKLTVFTTLDYLKDGSATLALVHLVSESADNRLKELALSVLGTIGDIQAYDVALAEFTNRSNSAPVRSAAAMALGRLMNRQATSAILTVLKDLAEPRDVRLQAAKALGELGDPSASSELASILRQDPESDLAFSLTVVQVLGKIGDADAQAALADVAQTSRDSTFLAAINQARKGEIS